MSSSFVFNDVLPCASSWPIVNCNDSDLKESFYDCDLENSEDPIEDPLGTGNPICIELSGSEDDNDCYIVDEDNCQSKHASSKAPKKGKNVKNKNKGNNFSKSKDCDWEVNFLKVNKPVAFHESDFENDKKSRPTTRSRTKFNSDVNKLKESQQISSKKSLNDLKNISRTDNRCQLSDGITLLQETARIVNKYEDLERDSVLVQETGSTVNTNEDSESYLLNKNVQDILLLAWEIEIKKQNQIKQNLPAKKRKKRFCDCEQVIKTLTDDNCTYETKRCVNYKAKYTCCKFRKSILGHVYYVPKDRTQTYGKSKRVKKKSASKSLDGFVVSEAEEDEIDYDDYVRSSEDEYCFDKLVEPQLRNERSNNDNGYYSECSKE